MATMDIIKLNGGQPANFLGKAPYTFSAKVIFPVPRLLRSFVI
jgi:succinyl-CoA synthetase beta subunit